MLFNIHINQKALYELGITELDYTDLAIYNAIEFACLNSDTIKLSNGGYQYTMASTKFIKQQLPFLQHSSGETIKRRIKKLIVANLIEAFEDNQSIQKSYYKMGSNFAKYKSYVIDEQPMSKMKDKTVKNERLPMSKMKDYNNIIYNNIKYKTKEEFFDLFYSKYPVKTHKKYALKSWLKLSIENMIKAIEGIPNFIKGKELKYIKNPQAYLNGEHWDDIPVTDSHNKPEQPKSIYRDANEVYKERIARGSK